MADFKVILVEILFLCQYLATVASMEAQNQVLDTCPSGWSAYNGNCFQYFMDNTRTFAQCSTYCKGLGVGAQLPCIHDSAENDFLYSLMPVPDKAYYLGATDTGHEGVWTWDDQLCDSTLLDTWSTGVFPWFTNEPNGGTAENCATYYDTTHGKYWNDLACSYGGYCICEISPAGRTPRPTKSPTAMPSKPTAPPSTAPSNPTAAPSAAPSANPCLTGWTFANGNCYKFATDTGRTFDQCTAYCEGAGADQVCVSSTTENSWLFANLPVTTSGYWVGTTDAAVEGTWVNENAACTSTYANWGAGQPSNNGGDEDCATLNYNAALGASWNDINCAGTQFCMCEYSLQPSASPTTNPRANPTAKPTNPSVAPSLAPTRPTAKPSAVPTSPSAKPTSAAPTFTVTNICDNGWYYYAGNCYQMFFDEKRTFDDCTAYCQGAGAQQPCVANSAQNDFIFSLIKNPATRNYWLGATDVSGTFTYVDPQCSSTYFPWAAGQPNSAGGANHCAGYQAANNDFYDKDCSSLSYCVCQSYARPSAAPSKAPSTKPTVKPTANPTLKPTAKPTIAPTAKPTAPTTAPSAKPTAKPTSAKPTTIPTSSSPTRAPTSAAPTMPNTCQPGWQFISGSCYLYTQNTTYNFAQCDSFCRSFGHQMACVEDSTENDAIYAHIPVPYGQYWIGSTDEGHEGTWTGIDAGCSSTFTAWAPQNGEPNGGTDENCAMMNLQGWPYYALWNDWSCDHQIDCLCEYTIPTGSPVANPTANPTNAPVPDPTANPTFDPTFEPTNAPISDPTANPTNAPTADPTALPTLDPTFEPTDGPSANPTESPTAGPSALPTNADTTPTANPTTAPSPSPCDEGWVSLDGNCYLYAMDSFRNFTQCTSYCYSLGAHPPCIINSMENSDLWWNAPILGGNYWLGMTDQGHEGTWINADPTCDTTFVDWNRGEPNNGAGIENCAIFDQYAPGPTWNDRGCDIDNLVYCICQNAHTPPPPPPSRRHLRG